MKNKLHIVPHEGEWAIRLTGDEEPVATYATQQAAIEASMELAQDEELDVVVHRRNGSFRNVISFDTIERRALEAEASRNFLQKPLIWGIFAAGAVTALAVYITLHPPERLRRYLD